MNDLPPWEVNPALTLDRLRVITDIIVRVRREVAESTDYEEGDGFFGLWAPGSRVHARLAHHIKRTATSRLYPWLTIVNQGLQFTFAIDGVPVRIYRGEAERPSRGARKVSLLEHVKQQELFDLGLITKPDLSWAWRIAVETEPDGKVFSVNILQVGPGSPVSVRNRFSIPLTATVPAVASVLPFTPAGVELEPAPVEAIEHVSVEDGEEVGIGSRAGTGTDNAGKVGPPPSPRDDDKL
jgi:hypothetical protein